MRGRVWPRLRQSQAELTKPSQFRLLLYDDAALGRGWWLERGSLGWRETFSPDMETVFDNTWNGEDNTWRRSLLWLFCTFANSVCEIIVSTYYNASLNAHLPCVYCLLSESFNSENCQTLLTCLILTTLSPAHCTCYRASSVRTIREYECYK